MDIPALATGMSQQKLMTNVGAALLGKSLDMAQELGDNMVEMMEQSVSPNLGQNIDITL